MQEVSQYNFSMNFLGNIVRKVVVLIVLLVRVRGLLFLIPRVAKTAHTGYMKKSTVRNCFVTDSSQRRLVTSLHYKR
jgi:hypothetical protein